MLPGAHGLVPLAPKNCAVHSLIVGLVDRTNVRPPKEVLTNALENVESAIAYLEAATTETAFIERWQKVTFDTIMVNIIDQTCPGLGTVVAANYANQITDQYEDEIYADKLFPRPEDELGEIKR